MSQRPSLLIVDSRARLPGGSLDSFQIRITPAIEGVRGVSLLYASLANPEDNEAELYWLARIREFGLPVRSAANADSATFVIPVSSAQGFRSLHAAESAFNRLEIQSPAQPIYSLNVEIGLPGGGRPHMTDEFVLIIGLEY